MNQTLNQRLPKTRPGDVAHWENITKVSWRGFQKTRTVDDVLRKSQSLPKHPSLSVLSNIHRRIENQVFNGKPITPVNDIYNIIADVDILRIAWAQIKGNKGALTPGPSEQGTAEDFTNQKLYQLSEALKTGTFQWSPIRRIWVEKPGKPEKRPLGLPNFEDKVVQAALRLVLESIYEPIFEHYNHNYGFRPKKDPSKAIQRAFTTAQGKDFAVEGDIKGAYNNVQHKIFMDKFSQVVQDKKVQKLVRAALESGIMEDGVREDTLLGIPQGGIVSPLLFNIYMHSFDLFVEKELTSIIEPEPQSRQVDPAYERNRSTERRISRRLAQTEHIDQITPDPFFDHCSKSRYFNLIFSQDETVKRKIQDISQLINNYVHERDRARLFNWRKSFKNYVLQRLTDPQKESLLRDYKQRESRELSEARDIRSNTTYLAQKPLKIDYVRYADDWVIFCSGDLETAEKIKLEVAKYLKNELGLTLSHEKTRITHLRSSKVQFLGFEMYYPTNAHLVKTKKGSTQRFRSFTIMPDTERLTSRFILKGYLDKKGKPREVGFLTVLQDHEIIRKYNQFIQGLVNYYIRDISYPSRVNRWIYILYYSCIKTLATKHRSSVAGIINKYGFRDISNPKLNWRNPSASDLRICARYTVDGVENWEVLNNYNETMRKAMRLRDQADEVSVIPTVDFLTLNKVNFRTKFKAETMCAVCNSPVYAMHHIKPIKHKSGRFTGFRGFDKLVASLGRKQIPVCSVCHSNIHAGRYNGLSLHDLYDIRLVAPESLLKFKDTPSRPTTPKKKLDSPQSRDRKVGPKDFIVNPHDKTYYNESLNQFLINKK